MFLFYGMRFSTSLVAERCSFFPYRQSYIVYILLCLVVFGNIWGGGLFDIYVHPSKCPHYILLW